MAGKMNGKNGAFGIKGSVDRDFSQLGKSITMDFMVDSKGVRTDPVLMTKKKRMMNGKRRKR